MRIGAHVSTAGKVYFAIHRAEALGISDIQIFPWSPRMWGPFKYSDADIAEFKLRRRQAGIKTVIFHNVYLINLAGQNHSSQSAASFTATIKQAEAMGVNATVVHLGHNPDHDAGLGQVIKNVFTALKYCNQSEVWLETTAGTRNSIGASMKDLGKIVKAVGSNKLGVLIDSCHVWAAGYDLKSKQGFDETMAEIDKEIGLKRIKGFHLNDAKGVLGSAKDRHENIGKGELGTGAFRQIMNYPAFAAIAGYLETPRESDADIVKDIKTLKRLTVA